MLHVPLAITIPNSTLVIAGIGALVAALGVWAMWRPRRRAIDWQPLDTPDGRAIVATRGELASFPRWSTAFANQRKDSRYFEVVEETILQGFDYYYLILQDKTEQA